MDKESISQADNFGSREHGSETEETSGDLFTATLWSNCHPAEWEDAGKTRDRDVFTNIETADHLSSSPALYPFASHRHQYNKKLIRGVEELRIVLFPPKYALWSSARADTDIREALITPPPAAAPINGNKWPRVKPCWGGVTQVRQNPRFPGYLQGHVTRVPHRALVCPRRGIVASVNSGETDVDVRHVLPCSGHPALDYNSVIFYIYFNSFESFVQSLTR